MNLLFVANWKMQRFYWQTIEWFAHHSAELTQLSLTGDLVICPTFLELVELVKMSKTFSLKNIHFGAQNCSIFEYGPYTGEVSARSLSEVGCAFAIIGHSERRILFHETSEDVALKVHHLINVGITPIICVGETREERDTGLRKQRIEQQLMPVLKVIKKLKKGAFCVAYEPVWSIGTGETPEIGEIQEIFNEIIELGKKFVSGSNIRVLYGGSVSVDNAKRLKSIDSLGGLLIGSASLNFQDFKKIVSC